MAQIDDGGRKAVMEQLGVVSDQVDFTLRRIARIAALSLRCPYASFSVIADGEQLHLVDYGLELARVPASASLCHQVALRGEELWCAELADSPRWSAYRLPSPLPEIHAYAGMPVYSDKVLIGTFSVFSDAEVQIDTDVNRAVMHDTVRLIEDSLIMRRAAGHDALTGTRNRRYFDRQIDAEWRRASRLQAPMSVAILDVDYFKSLNDTQGHAGGDSVLRRVAEVIKACLSRAGDIVCRYGGDEFAIILATSDAERAFAMAERICASVRELEHPHPARPDGLDIVTVSVGVSTVPSREDIRVLTATKVMALADAALYDAKQAGRNCARQKNPPTVRSDKVLDLPSRRR